MARKGGVQRGATHTPASGCGFIVDIIPPFCRFCKKKNVSFTIFPDFVLREANLKELSQKIMKSPLNLLEILHYLTEAALSLTDEKRKGKKFAKTP